MYIASQSKDEQNLYVFKNFSMFYALIHLHLQINSML